MKKAYIYIVIVIVFSNLLIANNYKETKEDSQKWISFVFDTFLQNIFPGGNFSTSIIENYFPETTSIIEESNGFAIIDNPKIYFEGESFTQFNWYMNGLDINSSLNDGSPGVVFPLLSVSRYELCGETPLNFINGLNQVSKNDKNNNGSKLEFSSIYSDLGTYSDWSQKLINTPASERDSLLSTTRRKPLKNFYLNYDYNKSNKLNRINFSLTYFDIKRQFNDFNKINTSFEETGKKLMALLRYKRLIKNGYFEFFSIFNNIDRSNSDSELGAYPQETTDLRGSSVLAGVSIKKTSFNLSLWFMYENEKRMPFTADYSKELMDNDGSGFIMPSKYGEFRASSIFAKLNIPINLLNTEKIKLSFYSKAKYSRNEAWEEVNNYNSFYVNKTPYLIREWKPGNSYRNENMNLKFGFIGSMQFSNTIEFFAKFYLHKNDIYFDKDINNLNFFTPSFDVGFTLWAKKKSSLLISYGISSYDIKNNVISFLEQNRPSSTYYLWNDLNNDMSFQDNERGRLFGYSGGKYHFANTELKTPLKERLLVTFNTKLSKNYKFIVKGILKRVKNSFWVYFDKEYGTYDDSSGTNLYYFEKPFKDYYLSNSLLEQDPFYAQLLINFIGKKTDKWSFSFSFMAHMGMGSTSFGNGYNNDIGVIDESMANRNTLINSYGRVDGDRGFVSKLNYGLLISKNLSMGLNIKYRDGNPFTFMKMSNAHNQWVIYYKTIKGEDKKGQKGGPREDYLAEINLKFNYKLRISNLNLNMGLSFFNILDVGYELSERVFTNEKDRLATELQIPRSIRLTLSVKF